MIDDYLKYAEGTEPPIALHRWCFLACTSAALGRRVWIPFGEGRIYPNMYVLIVGEPGTRKSTAISMAMKLLKRAGYTRFSATKTSKQKFLLDWDEGRQEEAAASFAEETTGMVGMENEMFIAVEELLDFLGPANIEFLNLLTTLWDNLDLYEERLKNSKSTIVKEPTVNVLGGLTPIGLNMTIPQEATGTGMLSRVILVHGENSRTKIPWPRTVSDAQKEVFSKYFKRVMMLRGELALDADARKMLGDIYMHMDQHEDVRLRYYCARRHTHLLKLCMAVMAARTEGTGNTILPEHVVEANTILAYTEATMGNALGEFGASRLSKAYMLVLQVLENATKPVNMTELWKACANTVDKFSDFTEVIKNLARAERIQLSNGNFILKRKKISAGSLYIDYSRYIPENPTNDHSAKDSELRELELAFEAVPTSAREEKESGW